MKSVTVYKMYDELVRCGANLPCYDVYLYSGDICYERLPKPVYYIIEQGKKYRQWLEDIQSCEIPQLSSTKQKEIIADFLHIDVGDIYSVGSDENNNVRLWLNNKHKLFPKIAYETGGAMKYTFRVTDDDNEKFEIIIRGWNS